MDKLCTSPTIILPEFDQKILCLICVLSIGIKRKTWYLLGIFTYNLWNLPYRGCVKYISFHSQTPVARKAVYLPFLTSCIFE